MKDYLKMIVAACCWLVGMAQAGGPPMPQGSAFTYQGILKEGGSPANGTVHLRFQLWDALTGGTQVGADVDVPSLIVNDGVFTASLDFGAMAFNGEARWLQVQVITNGGSMVTTLAPRQPVTAAPYAIFASNVDGSTVTNLNASNLVSGTVPSAQLGGTYTGALSLTNTLNTIAGTFSGSGAGVTNLSASNISSGTLAAARLPTGGNWPLTSTLSIGETFGLSIQPGNNRVGIGTPVPSTLLHLRSNGPVMILQDTASPANQAGYVGFWNNSGVETGWIGFGTPGSPHLTVKNSRTGGHIILSPQLGGTGDVLIGARLGVGTSDPQFNLHVNGTAGKPGGGSWSNSSDARLKKDIVDLDGALESLLALRGVKFEYIHPQAISEPPGRRIGMIAQEVEQVFPDWVSEGADGYKRLAFSGFEALTVEALRDLRDEKQAEIAALRAEVDALKARVQAVMRRERNGDRR